MELFKGKREEFLAYSRLTIVNRAYAKHRESVEIKRPSMGLDIFEKKDILNKKLL